jgi:hypothetical protein
MTKDNLPDCQIRTKWSKIYFGQTTEGRASVGIMIWMVEKVRTRLYLREFQHNIHVPIQIEVEYQLEGDRVFSSSLSRNIRYNRPLLAFTESSLPRAISMYRR